TARAIDMIPKSVVICDWHYEKAYPTAALFAMKGFDVITCPWRKPEVAVSQVAMMYDFKKNATPALAARYLGMMQTYWSSPTRFMEEQKNSAGNKVNSAECFKAMVNAIKAMETGIK
ncbi:MAG: glycoside hydrolase, partial [Maribacter sp.]|nr:glycoside hydrolase [Maribacter sp.]